MYLQAVKMAEYFKTDQAREGEFTGPRHALIHGVRITFYKPNIDKDFEKDLSRFETRPDDIYVVSYPKSGTTWVQEIVWQVFNDGIVSKEDQQVRFPFLEMSQLFNRPGDNWKAPLSPQPSPRLIKSHLPYYVIPMSKDPAKRSKYIYIARNPKDVVVSSYHFVRSFGPASHFHGTWEFFANLSLEGKGAYGLWTDHVLPYWEHRNDPHILFLKYEDLKKDLCTNVRRISEFVKKPLSEEMIDKITHQCTFAEMQKNSDAYVISVYPTKPSFLRKGEVGGWRSYFSAELNKKYDEKLVAKLKGTGLEFDFG